MTSFLILHGFGGSTDGHWQEWLGKELKRKGKKVYFPQFPDWNRPQKDVWLAVLKETLEAIPDHEKLVVVTHSLGCVLWFHYAALHEKRKVSRAIIVSPPARRLIPGLLRVFFPGEPERETLAEEALKSFYPVPEDESLLISAAERTLIVASSTDPFLPGDSILGYTVYGVPIVLLPDMGHINVRSGYGPWPWILDVCLCDDGFDPWTKG